jgi:hypothetical protein
MSEADVHRPASCLRARSRRVLGWRREDELTRGGVAPLPDPALKRTQLAIREGAWEFTLQAYEEFATDAIGLSFEPPADTRPHPFEGILARPPITHGPGRPAMGGANLAVLPRRRQAGEKAVQVSGPTRHVRGLPSGECGKVVLHRSNLLEQAERVELNGHGAQPIFHVVGHRCADEQSRVGRFGRVVGLADLRAETGLRCELEGRLKEVHEEPRRRVQPRQGRDCGQSFQAAIADESPHDGAVLLLHSGLIILVVRARPCARNAMGVAIGRHRFVHELAAVVPLRKEVITGQVLL